QADAAGGAGPKADEEGDKGDNGDKGDATQGAWRYRIGEFALDGGEVAFRDASVDPAGAIGLHDIRVAVRDISEDLAAEWPVETGLVVDDGGKLSAESSIVAGKPSADLKLELAGPGLGIAHPWLSQVARLRIVDGAISSSGRLRY